MPDNAGYQPKVGPARLLASGRTWLSQRSRTQVGLLIAGSIGVALLIAGLLNWQFVGRFRETTDNAYVRADFSVISAKISGYVREVPVTDNQNVETGAVLLRLDASDYEAALAQARANLARARAELASVGAERALAAADLNRYRPLARSGVLSPAGMQQIEARAAAMYGSAEASRAAVAAAQAQVEAAEINLERTVLRAPIAGVVGDRQVRVGQFVQPGAPLMAVVPLDALYVVANYKETQLAHIRPGQPAIVRPDVNRSLELHGVVDSISPASGAEFSIIPMDTATGNFTKIVQRVPVRIRLNAEETRHAGLLRPGLSATVTIDTHPSHP